ncbi:hypothetical protein [uncultured Arcticibacterium sp.]|uniref:hypothetical protein n=1 Tax=uncultured Arcticibacterium sp. TaxID=2173042 RepID=UPI0030F60445
MTQLLVEVPEGELDFFNSLIEKFKYNSRVLEDEGEFSPELKALLDERLEEDETKYVSFRESHLELKKKYGI